MASAPHVVARGSGPKDERGAAAVEFALVFPVVLLLVLGVMEFSLLMRDHVGVSNAVRDASRVASALPRQGTVPGHKGASAVPAVDELDWSFAYAASQVLTSSATAIPNSSIVDLWVYKANAKGLPEGLSSFDNVGGVPGCSTVPATCVRYAWEPDLVNPANSTFDFRSGTWDPASINACPNDPNAQAVGVFMRVAHKGLFQSFFNTTFNVSDASVVKFEPLRPGAGSCKQV